MESEAIRATVCTGVLRAREAARDEGQVSYTTTAAQLRIGSFARPLPADVAGTLELTAALTEVAVEFDPRLLDHPPILETTFGRIPVSYIDRCGFLVEKARDAADPANTNAKDILRAAAGLEERLRIVEDFYEARRQAVWQGMRDAEWAAADLLGGYLMANLRRVHQERERYLYKGGAPRIRSDDFNGLREAVKRVAARRRSVDLSAIKRERNFVDALALGMTVNAIAGSIQRLDFLMDSQAWAEMGAASQLSQEAREHDLEATAKYMETLRTEALKYPVILLLDHEKIEKVSFNLFADSLVEALDDCEEAIDALLVGATNEETFGEARSWRDLAFSGMAQKMVDSSKTSVWKLPFFMERALLAQPTSQANVVRRMMEYAAEVEDDGAIAKNLALMGTDTAMMAAGFTGYVGAAVAFTWGVVTLGRSIYEYEQLETLYRASIDPAVQLLEDHGPPSKLWVVLDVLGLIL